MIWKSRKLLKYCKYLSKIFCLLNVIFGYFAVGMIYTIIYLLGSLNETWKLKTKIGSWVLIKRRSWEVNPTTIMNLFMSVIVIAITNNHWKTCSPWLMVNESLRHNFLGGVKKGWYVCEQVIWCINCKFIWDVKYVKLLMSSIVWQCCRNDEIFLCWYNYLLLPVLEVLLFTQKCLLSLLFWM